jgi:hypothetical protein
MANTVTKTILHDGPRNVIARIYIVGDGSGEESDTILIDASALYNAPLSLKVNRVFGRSDGATAVLEHDGSTDAPICSLPNGDDFDYDWRGANGIPSSIATAPTGDITITTASLGAGDTINLNIWATKGAS